MATTLRQTSGENALTEDLGGERFRRTRVNEPASDHKKLPVSFVPASGDDIQLTEENDVVSVDASATAVDVFLPPASGNNGIEITVKNRKGGNTVTVKPNAATPDTIDDHYSVPLASRGDAATFVAIDNDVETVWIVTASVAEIS